MPKNVVECYHETTIMMIKYILAELRAIIFLAVKQEWGESLHHELFINQGYVMLHSISSLFFF